MRDSMHGSAKSVEIQSPAFASHSSMDHASFGSLHASHSRIAYMGNHCPDGCVHVTHSAVARRGMFIVDQVILRLLTRASLPGGPLLSVEWCALLKQRTFVRVCWRFSSLLKHFLQTRCLDVFSTFFQTFAFALICSL